MYDILRSILFAPLKYLIKLFIPLVIDDKSKLEIDFVFDGVRNAFKKAGVYSITIDGLETKLSSYSLRGTYITNRVQHGVPKEHIALACGTSATMIERYYSVAQSTDFLESFINLDQKIYYRT